MKIEDILEEDKFEYTTEKQILIRIRQILYDRKLSGTESNSGELNMLRRKLKDLRKSGLQRAGEFRVENLAFKELRNGGYLEKLSNARQELEDEQLSLDENQNDQINMNDLDPWTFDQTNKGWRKFKTYQDQSAALKSYIDNNIKNGKFINKPKDDRLNTQTIFWHLGQILAFLGKNNEAIKYMSLSLTGKDVDWDSYVRATISFLNNKQKEFSFYSSKVIANQDTLDRLNAGWGKKYSEVYETLNKVKGNIPSARKLKDLRNKKDVAENFTEGRAQEIVHKNPAVATLKALAKNNKYGAVRFVIYKDGTVVAADSELFTHHSMAPAMAAWAVRGYVQHLDNDDYAYRSMNIYDPMPNDHPLFRQWEKLGIENGNDPNTNTGFKSAKINDELTALDENFADGKGPGRPGDSQRHGIPKNATMAQLAKAAKAKGRKGQLARWQINMRRGKKRADEQELFEADTIVSIMDKAVEVLINPSYQRMLTMAKTANFPRLRALYVPSQDVVVVWPAELAIHYQMAQALVDQLGWSLGSDLKSAMTHHRLVDPMHPQSAILDVAPPMTDSTGKVKRDTNIHRRAGNFSVVALPKFYNIDWWHRIKRTAPSITETWSQKYKKSINCNSPHGFSQRAHCAARKKRQAKGKTVSKPLREDQTLSNELNAKLEHAAKQINLSEMPTVNGGKTLIVDLDRRPIVVVNFNGHHIPFYCSTGSGGKADVATGKWYPFWGIASDGWFNKGTSALINTYYNSPSLAQTAHTLDHTLGNLIGNKQIPMAGVSAVAVINQDQTPTPYRDAAQDLIKYYAGITDQVRRVTH